MRAPLAPRRIGPAAVAGIGACAAVLALGPPGDWKFVCALEAPVLVWLASIDLETRLLPDRIVLPSTAGILLICAAVTPAAFVSHLVAALGALIVLLAAAMLQPRSLGMGDAKLAGLIGALLGTAVFGALFIGFVLVGVLGVAILAHDGRRGLKRHVPLGPFFAAGAILALVLHHS